MAHPPELTIIRAELQQLLQGVAIHFLDRVYGPDGMPWGELCHPTQGCLAATNPRMQSPLGSRIGFALEKRRNNGEGADTIPFLCDG